MAQQSDPLEFIMLNESLMKIKARKKRKEKKISEREAYRKKVQAMIKMYAR